MAIYRHEKLVTRMMKKRVKLQYQSADGSWSPCSIVVPATIPDNGMAGHCRAHLTKMRIKHKKVAITEINLI